MVFHGNVYIINESGLFDLYRVLYLPNNTSITLYNNKIINVTPIENEIILDMV